MSYQGRMTHEEARARLYLAARLLRKLGRRLDAPIDVDGQIVDLRELAGELLMIAEDRTLQQVIDSLELGPSHYSVRAGAQHSGRSLRLLEGGGS